MSNKEDGFGVFIVRPADRADGIKKALQVFHQYGGIDGEHHKEWVLDQMLRALCGDYYDAYVRYIRQGEDGPETYRHSVGIPP